MGSDWCLPLTSEDDYERQAVTVKRRHASSFYTENTLPGSGRVSSYFTEGGFLDVKHRSDLCCPTSTVSERFLLEVFHFPQTGWVPNSPYPECSEQIFQEIQIQETNTYSVTPFCDRATGSCLSI